jgi:hypothetical protein
VSSENFSVHSSLFASGFSCMPVFFSLGSLLDRTLPHNLVNPLTGFSRKLCGGIYILCSLFLKFLHEQALEQREAIR